MAKTPASTPTVFGPDGRLGTIGEPLDPQHRTIELDDGVRVVVDRELVERRPDGSYFVPLDSKDLVTQARALRVPVVEERPVVDTMREEGARVTLRVRPMEREEEIPIEVISEDFEVKRVPVNRIVRRRPRVRREGEATIIPLVEEVVVIEKRLAVREEVHLIRHRRREMRREKVTLRSEQAEIERKPRGPSTRRA